jgi:hypothetical protein
LADTKDKLAVASDQISNLEQANLFISKVAVQFKAAAQKSELLLDSRTECFVVFREREKEDVLFWF